MPPQIVIKLCLFAFAMLIMAGGYSSAQRSIQDYVAKPQLPSPPQSKMQPQEDQSQGSPRVGRTNSEERRLIETKPFNFGCPRPPCRGEVVD